MAKCRVNYFHHSHHHHVAIVAVIIIILDELFLPVLRNTQNLNMI